MTTTDLTTKTRAELLELCQQRGLKATAWKKERMLEELAEPAPTTADQEPASQDEAPEKDAGKEAEQRDRETTGAENSKLPSRRSLTGWCARAPLWARDHLGCAARKSQTVRCECECHDPDWERPAIPEGAVLSKFNPENPLAEAAP